MEHCSARLQESLIQYIKLGITLLSLTRSESEANVNNRRAGFSSYHLFPWIGHNASSQILKTFRILQDKNGMHDDNNH